MRSYKPNPSLNVGHSTKYSQQNNFISTSLSPRKSKNE